MRCVFLGHRDVSAAMKEKIRKTVLLPVEKQPISCFYVGNNGDF